MPALFERLGERIESFLEREREQLPLWFVAAFGAGIAAWLSLPGRTAWAGAGVVLLALALAGASLLSGRIRKSLVLASLATLAGLSLIWLRAGWVAAPRIDRPQVAEVERRVERVEPRVAKGDVRLTLAPAAEGEPRLRVSMPAADVPNGLAAGALVRLRARIQPPPPMALPGTHDFARDLWFRGIGGVGRAIGPVTLVEAGRPPPLDGLRNRLGEHIRQRLDGGEGAIATALATGDQGAIGEEDAEAMRRSGLAHLLSVSGLHIAAVVGATMLLTLRLLALSPALAVRFNLVLVAAGAGALAGVAYTLLTGMQVPTVRSCIAALLVLGGIALGREAISLRLVAVGALLVLMFRPEALAGASFQLSFAAVTAIILLHRWNPVARFLAHREEPWWGRFGRNLIGLLLTGLAVEFALMPFALYHFHKAGLYGVAANLVAIPLTTFIIMPLEAAALALDSVGLGGPLWVATGKSIGALLSIAHRVGSAEGAVATLPSMPVWAFALTVAGLLWIALWRGKVRRLGFVPVAIGTIAAWSSPVPDMLITDGGRHLALLREDGLPVLLRSRSGDFMRDLMTEAAAYDGEPGALEEQRFARCSRDACIADIVRSGRSWRLLAIRSKDRIDWTRLTQACADADIVVAERRLPRGCTPRWLKLDRAALERTGGVSVLLGDRPRIETVAERVAGHPWAAQIPVWRPYPANRLNSGGSGRPVSPGSSPGRGDSAAPHNGGLPDRAGSSSLRGGTS
jgi:competence protein ComEC